MPATGSTDNVTGSDDAALAPTAESMGSDSIDLKLFFLSISPFATLLNLSCLANCVWKSKESDPIDLAKQTLREADNISFADRYC